MTEHRPEYIHCSDPENCCETWGPVAIVCAEDGEHWPCETKRSHHTVAYAARVERWVDDRLGRLAYRPGEPRCEQCGKPVSTHVEVNGRFYSPRTSRLCWSEPAMRH